MAVDGQIDETPQRCLVDGYPADGFGLYDVHVNVCKWPEDCRHEDV